MVQKKTDAANNSKGEYSYIELETVFIPADFNELLIAKSLLEGAGIRYFAKGEDLQNLYPGSRLGFGINSVELQVAPTDAVEAKELLEQLQDR